MSSPACRTVIGCCEVRRVSSTTSIALYGEACGRRASRELLIRHGGVPQRICPRDLGSLDQAVGYSTGPFVARSFVADVGMASDETPFEDVLRGQQPEFGQ